MVLISVKLVYKSNTEIYKIILHNGTLQLYKIIQIQIKNSCTLASYRLIGKFHSSLPTCLDLNAWFVMYDVHMLKLLRLFQLNWLSVSYLSSTLVLREYTHKHKHTRPRLIRYLLKLEEKNTVDTSVLTIIRRNSSKGIFCKIQNKVCSRLDLLLLFLSFLIISNTIYMRLLR